ncbi:MAG: glycerol-3-phosphate dehydrogenase [Acidobacteria bacterium]|nr:MAG: glycerol-3-phosphate dehydrogenase [Acidobacteriota bacterium]
MSDIAIIGAGAWGTALSIVLGRKGKRRLRLWAREKEVCDSITSRRCNDLFLPGQQIPPSVSVTNDLDCALQNAAIVVNVVPSHHARRIFEQMAPQLRSGMIVVSATKGVEEGTLLRMSEVIAHVVSNSAGFTPAIAALSGPTFAQEVARGDPTAITAASQDSSLAALIQSEFSDPAFRVYTNDDVIGVELGGALDGLQLGHNTVAALITRGLAEVTRLAVACGAKRETLAGLAGMGDLVLTCTGGLSRNRTVGVELGKGRKLPEIIAGMHGMVAEGVHTTNAAMGLAQKFSVEMPITEQMHAILHDGKAPRDAIRELMTRPGKVE